MDAGGNNRRLIRYFMDGDIKVVDGWLKHRSFHNLFLGPAHIIFVWFCSTHNMKSCRNQLLASNGSSGAARIFHDLNDVYFGWNGITTQWERELERIKKGVIQLTDLSIDSTKPDGWNKIRVTFWKSVFSKKHYLKNLITIPKL